MRTGFHTNAFVWAGVNDLQRIADFASENGFDFLEVGPGIPLDSQVFERVAKQVSFDAFIYCRNFIDDDGKVAEAERSELYRRMDFAGSIGAKRMICSTGISHKLSLPVSGGCDPLKSLAPAVAFLQEAVERAKQNGLELCLENCPMYRNIATSPLMWRKLFAEIPDENFGLCYDAGHFVWQMIDVYRPFSDFASRIRHIHMKDTWLNREKLDDVGILHNTGAEKGLDENSWWRHTIIGDGEIDWTRFLALCATLPEGIPDLSFELEDCNYELEPNRVEMGLKLQRDRLLDYLQRI